MIVGLVVLGVLWSAVVVVGAVAIGMSIADADRREVGPASCCPETVRGEFRAVVVKP